MSECCGSCGCAPLQIEESHASKIASLTKKYLANNYERILDRVFVSAEGSWIYDSEGRKYLDFVSCYSALNIGHGHPEIKSRIAAEAEEGLFALSQQFMNPWTAQCAQMICELTGMDKVVFKNGGTEAVEAAMKIARKWGYVRKGISKNLADIVFCENSFHGRTFGPLAASTNAQYREFFGPHLPGVFKIPFGRADLFETWIGEARKNIAAFIFEPIQGEGGVIVPPQGYYEKIRALCDKFNVLMIADEIQTGFGRTGKMFACDWENVKPDMYILGKALGGGLAISAVAGKKEVMDVLEPKDDGSTFGGNPFACAVSMAAMDVIKGENLPLRALISGMLLKSGLETIAKKSGYIKEVRGTGLMLGIELTEAAPSAKEIMRALLDRGLIVNDTKPNVLRIAPPLNISPEEMDFGMEQLEWAFAQLHNLRGAFAAS